MAGSQSISFNLLLFTVAPKPTSPDVLPLSIKDAPSTPQSAPDTEAAQTPQTVRPSRTDAPPTPESAVASSGSEPESSGLETPENLSVRVSSSNISLVWSAPDQAFDNFLVEVTAPSGEMPARVALLPGSARKAEIEGLSPSTLYNITLHGLVEGKRSLPLKAFAATGI